MSEDEQEDYEITETGAALTRCLREEAVDRGIDPDHATDAELLTLVALLPEEIVQDARDINLAMGVNEEETQRTLASLIRLMFEAETRPTPLN